DDIESFEIGSGPKPAPGEEEDAEEALEEEGEAEMAPLVPLDAAPESESETESTAEERAEPQSENDAEEPEGPEEEVFVNHDGAPVESFAAEEDDEDEAAPETKSEAAEAHLADYHGDAEVAAAEAVMENESEIEPVAGEMPADSATTAAEAAEE